MRGARILLPILAALAVSGCMQHGSDGYAGRGLFTAPVRTAAYAQEPAQMAAAQPPSVLQYRAPPEPAPPAPRYASNENNAPRYAVAADSAPHYAAAEVSDPPYAAASYAYAPAARERAYTLGPGDKLRIVVFGQEGISSSYLVDASGNVNVPLVGSVAARGRTTQQLAQIIAARLKQGYVRDPHVSVEVETYRPFFILGEVTTPGQYPYVADMTVEKAVAIAGGFSPRAYKRVVKLTRSAQGEQIHADVPLDYLLRPGDTIVVKERWF